LVEDESTSVVNGALVGVLLGQSASPSVICLLLSWSINLGFLTEGKPCCYIHHTFLLGFPTGRWKDITTVPHHCPMVRPPRSSFPSRFPPVISSQCLIFAYITPWSTRGLYIVFLSCFCFELFLSGDCSQLWSYNVFVRSIWGELSCEYH
jgi:hypothetical protein